MNTKHPARPHAARHPAADTHAREDRRDPESALPAPEIHSAAATYPAGLSVRAGSKNHLPSDENDHDGA